MVMMYIWPGGQIAHYMLNKYLTNPIDVETNFTFSVDNDEWNIDNNYRGTIIEACEEIIKYYTILSRISSLDKLINISYTKDSWDGNYEEVNSFTNINELKDFLVNSN